MAYKLLTDSTTDLPKEVIDKYNITIVPLSVRFEDKEYFNLEPKVFYEMLEAADHLPITSQVSPEAFIEAFKKVLDQGDKVICVTLGSNASGTFQSAMIAKESLETEDIILIDSNSLCLGTGMIVLKVARMLENGDNLDSIMEMVANHANNQIEHLFCVDTLKYLKKGGRIKASKAMVAEVLNIKPILNVENAITVQFGKVRGRNKVISYYVEHIKKTMDFDKNDVVLIGHSQDKEFAEKMVEALRNEVGYQNEIIIGEIGSVIGVHCGPGVLAIFYLKK